MTAGGKATEPPRMTAGGKATAPPRMTAARLLHWGDLDERRRRTGRRGLGALPPVAYSALAAIGLALIVARGMGLLGARLAGDATPLGASGLWLVTVAAGHALVLLGAPFRMFWRRDAAMVGRLPVPGRAAFAVALIRSVRATALVFAPCALAALVFAVGDAGSVDIALRHVAVAGIAALAAGLLGPAAALAGGAIVASDQAQAMLGSMGGEFQAPRSSWLGILPGVCGAALVLVVIACASWAQGADTTAIGSPLPILGVAAAVPIAAIAWAAAVADGVMLPAMREVSALDRERLAHVELTGPSGLERLVAGRLSAGARRVFVKDTSLARRRFPIPFFLGVVGVLALWIVAVARPDSALAWASAIAAGLGAYGVVMARRLVSPPIEHATFLRTLPIAPAAAAAAKQTRIGLWVSVYIIVGSAPVCARADDPALAAVMLGGIAAVSWVAGALTLRGS